MLRSGCRVHLVRLRWLGLRLFFLLAVGFDAHAPMRAVHWTAGYLVGDDAAARLVGLSHRSARAVPVVCGQRSARSRMMKHLLLDLLDDLEAVDVPEVASPAVLSLLHLYVLLRVLAQKLV